jgi:alanine-glyoxylate transaminase/serine-glyoxylate transaminase/serine-pyruvate transaminase
MLHAEGLSRVLARHACHAAATRAAVLAWGLEALYLDERDHSATVTAVLLPDEHNADKVRDIILDRFDMSLGASSPGGCSGSATSAISNDLTLAGTLAGVQMGLQLAEVPVHPSGVDVALELLRA